MLKFLIRIHAVVGSFCPMLTIALILSTIVVTPAQSEECSYAARNYHTYLQKCVFIDGCVNRPRMDSLVERACGYIPDENDSGTNLRRPEPSRTDSVPAPRRDDCDYLTARYERILGDFERNGGSKGERSSPGDLRFDGMDQDTLVLRKRLAEEACGGQLHLRNAGADKLKDPPSEPEGCDALRAYALNELPSMWTRTLDRLAIYRGGRRDLETLKRQLLDDSFWVGEWRELAALILKPLDAGGRLFENLLYVNPATARQARLLTGARRAPRALLRLLQAGKPIHKLVTEELEQAYMEILADMAKKTSPTTAAMKAVRDLSSDIATAVTIPDDFASIRRELAKQITNVNRQIDTLDRRIKNHEIALQTIENVRTAIELYCSSNGPETRLAGE